MRPRTFSASSPRGIGYGKTTSSWISPSARALEKLETMARALPPDSGAQAERGVEPACARRGQLDGPARRAAPDPAQVQQRGEHRRADLARDVRAALGPVQARARQRAPAGELLDVNADRGQRRCVAQGQAVGLERAELDQPVGERDAELAREVVV